MSATVTKLTPTSLSALLCARICHDLISPVGALGTAIEILDDPSNSDMHSDAMELIRNSSKQAAAKLKFLRLAFGAGGSAPGIIAVAELKQLTTDMFATGKADIIWDMKSDGLEKNQSRILLNLIMLGVQSVPRGGTVMVRHDNTAGSTITVAATGRKARLDEAVSRALAGKAPAEGFDGRSIQPLYTSLMVRDENGTVEASVDGEVVTITAQFPPTPA